ncbi:MAG: hypothetical protein Q8S11_00195 [Daejeonella sp.]|uniref:hypothetical protein n=1 Tax=Daejeonella sp. TaxID=2805397 RepID=UPI00273340C1|nr:hypothetical protein [Daejeonella sp.]MDP3466720.1 hypothetical protein [Daejeonella sp.]
MEQILPIQLRTNFKSDSDLVSRILELTNASYITNTRLIEREIEHNHDIYIINNYRNDLLAFFMVNFEPVIGIDSFYLGLSACRDDLKGNGLGKSLYLNFLKECREKEILAQKKFLLWWTTATPIVYYWFNKYVSKVQPDINGNYDEHGKKMVESIIKEKFPELEVDKLHPFILRSVAENTVYSISEQQRLIKATKNLGMDVFQRFNLKEENADRFLMFGYAPD